MYLLYLVLATINTATALKISNMYILYLLLATIKNSNSPVKNDHHSAWSQRSSASTMNTSKHYHIQYYRSYSSTVPYSSCTTCCVLFRSPRGCEAHPVERSLVGYGPLHRLSQLGLCLLHKNKTNDVMKNKLQDVYRAL